MLTKYQLMMPHAVFSGKDALEKIPEILAENKVRRLAVFADKGIEAAGLLELPMAQVRKSGVDTVILDDLRQSPPTWRPKSWWTSARPPVPTSSWP